MTVTSTPNPNKGRILGLLFWPIIVLLIFAGCSAINAVNNHNAAIAATPVVDFSHPAPHAAELGMIYIYDVSKFINSPEGEASYFLDNGTSLPPGLELSAASGVIIGTPTLLGTFDFVVTLANKYGARQSAEFTINVGEAQPLQLPPPSSYEKSTEEMTQEELDSYYGEQNYQEWLNDQQHEQYQEPLYEEEGPSGCWRYC